MIDTSTVTLAVGMNVGKPVGVDVGETLVGGTVGLADGEEIVLGPFPAPL